jgi:hypothetical protein
MVERLLDVIFATIFMHVWHILYSHRVKVPMAHPKVWMVHLTMRPDDSHHYWEQYVLLYTDDCLVISHRGESAVLAYEMKAANTLSSWRTSPFVCQISTSLLGGKLRKVKLTNGNKVWAFGSSQYVQAAVHNVEKYHGERNVRDTGS